MKKDKVAKQEKNVKSAVDGNVVFPTMGAAIVSNAYGKPIQPIELKNGALTNARIIS